MKDDRVTFQLYDTVHSIPKYTIVIAKSMKITFFAFNWPIPHDHPIYNECKHSISTCGHIKELLNTIEKSMLLPRSV